MTTEPQKGRRVDLTLNLNDFIPYIFNRITNCLNLDVKADLRKLKLTIPRWRILAALSEQDGLSIGQLAFLTAMLHAATSRVVDQMERDRLVRRKISTSDNRITNVYLTDKGTKVFEKLVPRALSNQAKAIDGLTDEEVATLKNLLRRVLHNIDLAE